MVTETDYGVRGATPSLLARDLLRVPHKGGTLVVAYPAFGPSYFNDNVKEMQRKCSHSEELPQISFREPTTAESTSAAVFDFEHLAKPEILDPRWLQLGRIVRTSEGVFANPPKDAQGNPTIDEKTLKRLINNARKVNGIYVAENDFGFAPYGTFQRGVQEGGDFAEGGLARVLEHTEGNKAENLGIITSPKFYKKGVDVYGFGEVKEPVSRVAGLGSGGSLGVRLVVDGGYWGGNGCAFGALDSDGASSLEE